MWRVHDERPDRRVGGGATHLIAVESPGACVAILAQGHEPRHEPEDLSLGRIELMVGLHRHDAVTRIEQRTVRHRQAFARTQHHRDLLLRVRAVAVEFLRVVRDREPGHETYDGFLDFHLWPPSPGRVTGMYAKSPARCAHRRAPPVPLLADAPSTGGTLNEFFFDDPASRDEESW